MTGELHLHLVSDATGETIQQVARACLVQFEEAHPVQHVWTLVRTHGHLDKVIAGIEKNRGLVLFTFVDPDLRRYMEEACRRLQVPQIAVLDPVMAALANLFGQSASGRPGMQHELDAEYFARIEAVNFTLAHDDGQNLATLGSADIILVGVSRTSKTPTSIYLANRGYKTANVPIVPEIALPDVLFKPTPALIVGLTNDPERLVQVRRNRLLALKEDKDTGYVDYDRVREEVVFAKRLFARQSWPVIDTTRRSIEETAAAVIQLLERRRENGDG
jgi:regulator of PEP synthase PpsR (kinase-PPPase family)